MHHPHPQKSLMCGTGTVHRPHPLPSLQHNSTIGCVGDVFFYDQAFSSMVGTPCSGLPDLRLPLNAIRALFTAQQPRLS